MRTVEHGLPIRSFRKAAAPRDTRSRLDFGCIGLRKDAPRADISVPVTVILKWPLDREHLKSVIWSNGAWRIRQSPGDNKDNKR